MPLSNKYLQTLVKQYEDLKTSVNNLNSDLTEEQFNAKPAPDRWSVGECIEHLNASWDLYKELLQETIDKNQNPSIQNPDEYKPRFLMKKFTGLMEPPYKFKMKTFSMFIPKEKLNREGIINKFNSDVDVYINFIKSSEKVDIKKTIVVSPVSKIIKYQAGELFPFLAAHARRHIWQAENVKKLILE